MSLLIWSATTEKGNIYTVEWKDGEFFTLSLSVDGQRFRLNRSLAAVMVWLQSDTNLDKLSVLPGVFE